MTPCLLRDRVFSITLAITFLGISLWFAPGFAQEKPARGSGTSAYHPLPMASHSEQILIHGLTLTAKQQKEIDHIQSQAQAQIVPMLQSAYEQREDLMKYMASPQSTKTMALRKEQEVATLQNQIEQLQINTLFKMKACLSPEQQVQLGQLMQEKGHEIEAQQYARSLNQPTEGEKTPEFSDSHPGFKKKASEVPLD